MADDFKRCPRCGNLKSLDEFGSSKSKKDGHSDYCMECAREITREQYQRNKERKKTKAVNDALSAFTDKQLTDELFRRGLAVLVNPQPRDLMTRLVELGYVGTLEYYEKKVINLNTIKQ